MKQCYIRFYGRLKSISGKEYWIYSFRNKPTIIDIIEALGVPHTEVYFILKNQQISGFYDHIYDNDKISAYPKMQYLYIDLYKHIMFDPFLSKKIKKDYWFKFQNYKISKFIADVHLGKLVKYLRFLGIDILYNIHWDDTTLIRKSIEEKRILLTQDKGILKQKIVQYGCYIINREPPQQLLEFFNYFSIRAKPFTRCSLCNHLLIKLSKMEIKENMDYIPSKIKQLYEYFYYCPVCKKYYWEGSHYKKLINFYKSMNLL
ncbi:MAG: hypothetical protein KatS3mg129_0246 [Leptospiraceae bacterium]|nr:MAG: hypothetical protein KatS3mg129_0246 [Leptospiraceae bacterium]